MEWIQDFSGVPAGNCEGFQINGACPQNVAIWELEPIKNLNT